MPPELEPFVRNLDDLNRDILRLFFAIGTLLLPIAYIFHSRLSRRTTVPEYLREAERLSNAQANSFLRTHLFQIFWLALAYAAWYFVDWNEISERYDLFEFAFYDWVYAFIYPLFSFCWLWQIRKTLQSMPEQSWKSKQSSMFVTMIWTVFALTGAKSFAWRLGLFSLVYVVFAIRGDLSLALIISRGANPLSAYMQSFKFSKKRFSQFSWLFCSIAALAWFAVIFSKLTHAIYFYIQPAQSPGINLNIALPILIAVDTTCSALLTYFDSQLMLRGVKLAEAIEMEESGTNGG